MTADSGVVHQDVQLAELGHGGGDGILPLGLTGYVQRQEDGLAAGFTDLGGDTASFFFQDVADGDHGAFRGE